MKNIIFKSMELENFQCHEALTFDFTPHRFISVVGKNGSGKTTIFDGLSWILYDKNTKGRGGDSIVRKRTGKNTKGRLLFSIDDDEYEIINYQKHQQGGNSKILRKNGKDIQELDRKQTTDKIENILMPEDIFLNCLLFSQFAKKPFSTLEHSKQKEILDIMLGFNQYDIYQKKFSDTLKIYQEQTNIHNTKIPYIENNILNINNSIFELDKRYSEKSILLNNRILEINNEIFNDEEFYKNNIRILDELSKKEKILNNIQNLKSEKTERKNILTQQEESQINQLKDKFRTVLDKNISDEKLKIKDDLSSVDLEIQQVENKLLETKTQEKSELDKINFLKSEKISSLTLSHNMKINELKTNYDNIKQSINFNQSNYKKLNTNILELHSKIEKIDNFLKKDIPLCYTCGQEIKNNEIDKIQEEKSIIESQISSNKLELKNIEEEFFTLSKTLLNIEKKETKEIEIFKKLTSEIQTQFKNQIELNNEKYKNMINGFDENRNNLLNNKNKLISSLNDKLTAITNDIKNLYNTEYIKLKNEINKQIENINIEIERYNLEYNNISHEISNLKERKEIIDKILTKISIKKEEINKINNDIVFLNEEYKNDKLKLNNKLNSETLELSSAHEIITKLNKKIEIIKFWIHGFGDQGIRSILLDESIPVLNSKAIELSKLTDGIKVSFDSQKELKSGDLRNKFSINIVQTKNLTDDPKDLSGGESRIVNIIILMSLRYLLEKMHGVKINILLLDEILDSLDPDNVSNVLSMIKKILNNDQTIILISHTLRDIIDSDETFSM